MSETNPSIPDIPRPSESLPHSPGEPSDIDARREAIKERLTDFEESLTSTRAGRAAHTTLRVGMIVYNTLITLLFVAAGAVLVAFWLYDPMFGLVATLLFLGLVIVKDVSDNRWSGSRTRAVLRKVFGRS